MGREVARVGRLRLLQGSAATSEIVLEPGRPQQWAVGRHPKCDWVIAETRLAPVHFTLRWDGAALTVCDSHGVGGITLDGVAVPPFFIRVEPRKARLEFARCAIVAEVPGPSRVSGMPMLPVRRDGVTARSGLVDQVSRTLKGLGGPEMPTTAQLSPEDGAAASSSAPTKLLEMPAGAIPVAAQARTAFSTASLALVAAWASVVAVFLVYFYSAVG